MSVGDPNNAEGDSGYARGAVRPANIDAGRAWPAGLEKKRFFDIEAAIAELRPGLQDITAHVNFSALIEEGRRHGLRLKAFTTQRAWLQDMDISGELERMRLRDYGASVTRRASDEGQVALLRWYSLRQGAAVLMDPAGMGNFKVLVMGR